MTPPKIHVRKARWKDAQSLVALVNQLSLQDQGKGAAFGKKDVYRHLWGRHFRMLVAEREGKVVGMTAYHTTYGLFSARLACEVLGLVVSPEYRRQGVGRALMAEVARISLRKGWQWMGWHVMRVNDPAKAFYVSLGAVVNEDICYGGLQRPQLEAIARYGE